jgi:hypothetical protein
MKTAGVFVKLENNSSNALVSLYTVEIHNYQDNSVSACYSRLPVPVSDVLKNKNKNAGSLHEKDKTYPTLTVHT